MRLSGAFKRFAGVIPLALSLTGCLYGFKGGGLPSHIHTFALIPFDNQTPVTDVQREISDSLRVRLAAKLGLHLAPENNANAIVRGVIRRYELDIPVGYDARSRNATSVQRQLDMVVDIDVVDQSNGKSLFTRKNFEVQGNYPEGQQALGRSQAVDLLVTAIVDGVQSQW